jgi:molybdopterin molybdotransferase
MKQVPLSISELHALIEREIRLLGVEKVSIETALNRTLAEVIQADHPMPAFDRVMMDGIAVKLVQGQTSWKVIATQFAGDPPKEISHPSDCVEVMTGAVLPTGCDTVIPLEDFERQLEYVSLNPDTSIEYQQFVHPKGSDKSVGGTLLDSGTSLTGRALAVAASVGKTSMMARKLPKVAFVSTGHELVGPADPLTAGKIRRTNDQVVAAELKKVGIPLEANLHLEDDNDRISKVLKTLRLENDLIVCSGGVSKGKADYIRQCAEEDSFTILAHGISQKPGGPLLLGLHENGCVLLGLPGNPLSTTVCARVHLRKVIASLSGYPLMTEWVELVKTPRQLPSKTLVANGILQKNGKLLIQASNTSGDFTSVVQSDGCCAIPSQLESQGDSTQTLVKFWDWLK